MRLRQHSDISVCSHCDCTRFSLLQAPTRAQREVFISRQGCRLEIWRPETHLLEGLIDIGCRFEELLCEHVDVTLPDVVRNLFSGSLALLLQLSFHGHRLKKEKRMFENIRGRDVTLSLNFPQIYNDGYNTGFWPQLRTLAEVWPAGVAAGTAGAE